MFGKKNLDPSNYTYSDIIRSSRVKQGSFRNKQLSIEIVDTQENTSQLLSPQYPISPRNLLWANSSSFSRSKNADLIEPPIEHMRKFLQGSTLILGGRALSIHNWLQFSSTNAANTPTHKNSKNEIATLGAGFQAAAINSKIEEILFFLEHLSLYLSHMEQYFSLFNENKRKADQYLVSAIQTLDAIWTSCFVQKNNPFNLNISQSDIPGGASGFKAGADDGMAIIASVANNLRILRVLQLPKSPKSYKAQLSPKSHRFFAVIGQLQEQTSMLQFDRNKELMIATLNKANQVFARLLPEQLGVGGVQQFARSSLVAEQAMQKWSKCISEQLPLWDKEQRNLNSKIKQLGEILNLWLEKNLNHRSVGNTSRRGVKLPPGIDYEKIEELKNFIPPATLNEKNLFTQILKVFKTISPDDRKWGTLKLEIDKAFSSDNEDNIESSNQFNR
ncbi:hypothetical protein EP47_04615 [Legionella norrlandica]|uniref:Uncharacterized protein n=1 Tax=Legionella norrlandica TaxID=1498499 RepID=A0A0A2T6M2_9GAMM|nr:hypothetical protein [Legionella norrlandica]KGP63078.1 hypothetical protein EP47_04615 [Legionella norrlandica]